VSDERLRELERRWRETGDDADERRWLEARVRAGDLDPLALELLAPIWAGRAPRWRLEVLAYAGDPLARGVVDEEELVARAAYLGDTDAVEVLLGEEVTWEQVHRWAVGLFHWGNEAAREVLVALLGEEARTVWRLPRGTEYDDGQERRRAVATAIRALPELQVWFEDVRVGPGVDPEAWLLPRHWVDRGSLDALVGAAVAVTRLESHDPWHPAEHLWTVFLPLTGHPPDRLAHLREELRRALLAS
jgi:hypothetical protein